MAGKVFFSVTMSLDGFMAPEAVPVKDVFSPETLAPVLFGTGIRLFDRVDPDRLALEQTRTDASARVTHMTYTVGKR